MYIFPFALVPQAFSSVPVSLSQLHARMGHPSMHLVQQIISQVPFPIVKSLDNCLCSTYCQAKHKQLLYFRRQSTTTTLLQLIFLDIWGPTPLVSHGSFHYYVSFVDILVGSLGCFLSKVNLKCFLFFYCLKVM